MRGTKIPPENAENKADYADARNQKAKTNFTNSIDFAKLIKRDCDFSKLCGGP